MLQLQNRNLLPYITFVHFCLVAFVISAHPYETEDLGTIIASNVVFRHGHRTIIQPYPNDPYKNESFWPEGWGQLTNIGKMQEYKLGLWLRQRYTNFISESYSRKEVYIVSTDVERTLMSAESNLAGLYPPKDQQIWNEKIAWQPIPVHTTPEHLDSVLAMKAPCPKFDEELKKVMSSKAVIDLLASYEELFGYLSMHTGEKVTTFGQAQNIRSTLFIEKYNNFSLPDWTHKVFPEPLSGAAANSFAFHTFTDELRRLKTGPLMKEMLDHFTSKVDGVEYNVGEEITEKDKKNIKLWIYSAHDETVANVLNTLKVFDVHNPPFSACVLLELRKKDDEYYVTVSYRNSSDDAVLLTIPGCKEMCPYNDFMHLLKPLIPSDWEAECNSHKIFDLTDDLPYNSLAVFVMIASTVLVFLLLTSMSIFFQKQKPNRFYRKLKTDSI